MFKFTSCVLLNGSSLSFVVFGIHQAKLGSGRLMGPKGVSVDQNGHVIVVDNKACTVFIFDQWRVSLQAQCGCRDVRRNGDGRGGFGGQSRAGFDQTEADLR